MSEGKQEARELRELRAWLRELLAWKESAMKVIDDLKLQECGEALGLPLGSDIAKHILPALLATRQANQPQPLTVQALKDAVNKHSSIISTAAPMPRWEIHWDSVVDELNELLVLQPQGKAQPESGDLPELLPFDEFLARYRPWIECVEQKAFQRGQQAMAEKAAQQMLKLAQAIVDGKALPSCENPLLVSEALKVLAESFCSLASAEPPQGEAEKEGRT